MGHKYWDTAEGERIRYDKLDSAHLLNILKWIEKRAEEGITLTHGGGHDIEDMWYEEEELIGKQVLKYFDYKGLCKEVLKRGLLTEKEYLLKN